MSASVLSMTKLVVADLKGLTAFYTAVTGLAEANLIEGPGFAEQILRHPDKRGAGLVLYADGTRPPAGEAILVFDTDDLAAFGARVAAAGGTLDQPPQAFPSAGIAFAFYRDPEGHRIEAIAPLNK